MSSDTLSQSQATNLAAQSESAGYQAPYRQNESPYQDHYIIAFNNGHTLTKHFAFLGKELGIEGTLNEGYDAKLDRELFEAVRRDAGVELIEDDTLGGESGPSEEELKAAAREEAREEREEGGQ